MQSKALKLASLFSYSPNHKGYCGRDSAGDVFTRCILKGECEKVPRELKHFIVLYPYLKTIATLTGLSLFDHKVVEAYWIGNELLEKIPVSGYDTLLKEFKKQGVPSWLINTLRKKKPVRFIPNHLFQVLHVGVGQASGSVPFDIQSINSCMIRWGKVLMVKADGTVTASLKQLTQSGAGYKLTKVKTTLSAGSSPFFKPKVGEIIAVHWGHIVKRLARKEETNLTYWTKQMLLISDQDIPHVIPTKVGI
jgi:hypothetical protein